MDVRSRGFDPRHAGLLASSEGALGDLYLDCAALTDPPYDERGGGIAGPLPPAGTAFRANAADHPRAESRLGVNDPTNTADLRDVLRQRYGGAVDQPVITVASFGFARGISRTADLVFDMRFIANPHWVDDLRPQTGEDEAVQAYVTLDPAWGTMMDQVEELLTGLIPRYWAAGKSYLTIAFGCTGGRHRSVAAAVEMAKRLHAAGFSPIMRHRDLASPPSDTIEGHPVETGQTGE